MAWSRRSKCRATARAPRRAQAAGFGGDAARAARAAPQGAAARTLAVMGTAERAWRKGLSFAFVVLVVIAAVFAGLAIVGVATGVLPVQIGDEVGRGPTGALIGTAGIAASPSPSIVLALAIVLAVVYGLGFLIVGPRDLHPGRDPRRDDRRCSRRSSSLGLGVWWLVRCRSAEPKAAEPRRPTP